MHETKRRQAALTLAELVISLAITSLIGLAVAGASMALSTGYEHGEEYSDAVTSARVLTRHIQALVARAKLIAAVGNSSLVVWDDADADGRLTESELVLIFQHQETREMLEYRIAFPDSWSEAMIDMMDSQVPLACAVDLYQAYALLAESPYLQVSVLDENTREFSTRTPYSGPINRRIEFTIVTGSEDRTFTIVSGAGMRDSVLDEIHYNGIWWDWR
jgi:hypothetical protein